MLLLRRDKRRSVWRRRRGLLCRDFPLVLLSVQTMSEEGQMVLHGEGSRFKHIQALSISFAISEPFSQIIIDLVMFLLNLYCSEFSTECLNHQVTLILALHYQGGLYSKAYLISSH